MDLLWRVEVIHPHGTHGDEEKSLVLVGAQALAITWGLEVLSPYVSRIPLEFCLPPKGQRIHKKNKGVGAWNSLAYHTHLPGPRAPRIRKDGTVKKPHDNHPYSRAKIREDSGVPIRSQQRYQKLYLPNTHRKVTRRKPNFAKERVPLPGKSRTYWAFRRLGNSFTAMIERVGWGQGKTFNKRNSGFWPHARYATGSSSTGRTHRRRFFERAKDLMRADRRDGLIYAEPMLRVHDAARMPWAGWWEAVELYGQT